MGPQAHKIGGEADGVECEEDEDVVEMMVVVVVEAVVEVKMEAEAVLDRTIPWLVIGAGCVVIWPATVLKPVIHRRREVALPALPVEVRLNPCKEAQEAEAEEVDRSDSVASASCMTTRVINTPSMMQDSCMCH